MLRVPTSHLVPGQRLARPVTDATGRILLAAGMELKASYIDYLRRHGIPAVYVQNELAPDLQPPEDVVSDQTRQALGAELQATLTGLKQALSEKGRAGLRRWAVDSGRLGQAVTAVVDEILANPQALVHLQDIRLHDEYTVCHSVNVCILATLTAASMGYDPRQLRDVALGAVLHDIGKVMVPEAILNKPGPLTPEEYEVMKQHTTLGFEILCRQVELSYHVAHVAWQHHERWGGGGYPRGIQGHEIHEYARIVAVADVYDAMTADRIYRKGYTPDRALRHMTGEIAAWFEPAVLEAFMANIAVYPVGTVVELNTGEVAVVTAVTRGQATRPVVRVVKDPQGQVLTCPFTVDLAREEGYEIVKVLAQAAEGGPTEHLQDVGEG